MSARLGQADRMHHAAELALRRHLLETAAEAEGLSFAQLGARLSVELADALLAQAIAQDEVTLRRLVSLGRCGPAGAEGLVRCSRSDPDRPSLLAQAGRCGLLSVAELAAELGASSEFQCVDCQARFELWGADLPAELACPAGCGPDALRDQASTQVWLRSLRSDVDSRTRTVVAGSPVDGGSDSPEPPDEDENPTRLLGQELSGWRLMELIGSGGMGAVFRARDARGEEAALKVILRNPHKHLPRFRQEAEVTRSLVHTGIVGYRGWGEEPVPHLALEYVPGTDLEQMLTLRGRLPPAEVAEIAAQILRALEYAHAQGVIHRDLKPGNVLRAEDGRVLLADFGLGRNTTTDSDLRLTLTGRGMGTVYYVAPEQVRDAKSAGPAADIYSAGCILFQLLSGQPPFTGGPSEILISHSSGAPPDVRAWNPLTPPALAALIGRQLAKEPGQRPTAAAALGALADVRAELAAPPERTPGEQIDLRPGDRVGCWCLEEEIGAGGMGKVFRAAQADEQVALKVLRSGSGEAQAQQRFEREVALMREVQHPNVARLLDSGLTAVRGVSYRYMALELARQDLGSRLEQRGPLEPQEACEAAIGAARGLAAAHARGIVHRDVKPENLLLAAEEITRDALRVSDFGVAALKAEGLRLTRTGAALGSPYYMAPEQARGKSVDARADVYALGATLYHLLTGARPFVRDTLEGLLLAHATELYAPAELRNPRVPAPLARIVDWALLKRPEDRPAGVRDLEEALEAWLADGLDKTRLRELQRRVEEGQRPFRPGSRLRTRLVGAAALLLALLVGGGLWLRRPDPQAVVRQRLAALGDEAALLEEHPTREALEATRRASEALDRSLEAVGEPLGGAQAEQARHLRRALDRATVSWAEGEVRGLDAAPLAPDLAQRTDALQDHLQALARRSPEQPWSAEVAQRLDGPTGLLAEADCLGRVAGLARRARSEVERPIEDRAWETGLAALPALDRAAQDRERACQGRHRLPAALCAHLQALRDRLEQGRQALTADLTRLEVQAASVGDQDAQQAARAAVTRFIDALPPGNPQLRARATQILRQEDPDLTALRDHLARARRLRADAPAERTELLQLLNEVADPRFARYAEYAELRQLRDEVIGELEAEARAAFAALCAQGTLRLQARREAGTLSPADFQAQASEARAFGQDARWREWAGREAAIAERLRELESLEREQGLALQSRALADLERRPDGEGSRAFLARLRQIEALLVRARVFTGHYEASCARAVEEVRLLRSLHDDDRMVDRAGGATTIGHGSRYDTSYPPHPVQLEPYRLDRTEVSVSDYARFLSFLARVGHERLGWCPESHAEPAHTPRDWKQQTLADPTLPVRGVTWPDAQAFARWAGKRLPDEREWEAAAREGGGPYAWGARAPTAQRAVYRASGLDGPAGVGTLPAGMTGEGILHLSGNVAEWTTSPFQPYPGGDAEDFAGLRAGAVVVRGGSFLSLEVQLQVWLRTPRAPDRGEPDVGFRCASDP